MTVSSGSPAILPPTIESWVAADRALDAGRMRDLMAPAIVLASPLTDAFDFTGPDDVAAVFAAASSIASPCSCGRWPPRRNSSPPSVLRWPAAA